MIDNRFLITISAGIIACIITTIGIYVINKFAKWGKKNIIYFISFAAGVLISVSFMHIIPESFEMNAKAPIFLLVGFLALYLFNRFLKVFVCNTQKRKEYAFGIIPALGIGFHSFLDGIIYYRTSNDNYYSDDTAACHYAVIYKHQIKK